MGWKIFFSIVFILFVVSLLVFYWFIPFNTIEFGTKSSSSNFSLSSETENMQFYSNMRFAESRISYKIGECSQKKRNDMENAFEIIENLTTLSFYPIVSNEEISITCDAKNKIEGSMFIAGEGGPTNVSKTNKFYVISGGKILLIRSSPCIKPNVAIHELLHVLGFGHSTNKNNVMYNFSNCKQTIGQDTIDLINKLYSFPSYSDLEFENVSATMHGKRLDTEVTIKNNGLKDSEKANLIIYADEKIVKEIEVNPIGIGYGKVIILTNVLVKKLSIKELKFVIESDFNELDKDNNERILKIKK